MQSRAAALFLALGRCCCAGLLASVPQACAPFHIAVQKTFQSLSSAPIFTLIIYAAFDTTVTGAIAVLIVYTFFGYGAPGLPE